MASNVTVRKRAEYGLKAAVKGFPKTIVETLSAFANASGGAIILGAREGRGFHPAEGFGPKTAQAGYAQAARGALGLLFKRISVFSQ